MRQAGGQPAGRGAECGWDGAGKCTPSLDSARSAELIQSWSFNRKEKGTMGSGGVLSTPDARSVCFSVVHSTSDCVQPSSHFNFDLLKD